MRLTGSKPPERCFDYQHMNGQQQRMDDTKGDNACCRWCYQYSLPGLCFPLKLPPSYLKLCGKSWEHTHLKGVMRCTLPVLLLLLPPVLPPVILPALMVPGTLPRLPLPSLCASSMLQPLEPSLHSHSAPLAMHALPCMTSCMLTASLQRPAMLRWQRPAQHKG